MQRATKKALSLAVGGFFISGIGSAPAWAGVDVWNSSTDRNWTDMGVWNPSQPGQGDIAFFGTSVIPPLVTNNGTFAQVNINSPISVGGIFDDLADDTAGLNTKGLALTLEGPTSGPTTITLYGQTYTGVSPLPGLPVSPGNTSPVPNVILANYTTTASNLKTFDVNGSLNLVLANTQSTILTSVGTGSGAGQTIEVDGNISDGFNGASALTVYGGGTPSLSGGTVQLYGTNSFSGGITVGNTAGSEGAALEINPDTVSLNTGGTLTGVLANNTGTGNVTINEQSQLLLNGTGSGTTGTLYFMQTGQTLTINGIGENKNSSGNIRTNGKSTTQTYDILANVVFGTAAPGDSTGGYIIISPTSAQGKTIQFSGTVTGSGSLQKQGSGNLEFSNPNNVLSGATQIGNGYITVDPGSSMGTGDLFLDQTSTNFTVVALNNTAQTVGSLSSAYTDTLNGGSPIGGTNAPADDQYLNLQGPGQSLTGPAGTGTVLELNQNKITQFGYSSIAGLNTETSTIQGPGSIQLNSGSTGILTLNGSNTYTGGTVINGGTLNVANGIGSFQPTGSTTIITANSATGSGDVTVNSGGTLISGNGAVLLGQTMNSGSIGGNVNVSNGGIVNAGGINQAGILDIGGNLNAAAGSILDFDLIGSTAAAADQINVAGKLNVTSGVLLNVEGSTLAFGTYPIFTFGSLPNGTLTLPTINSVPNPTNRTYTLVPSGNTLDLQIADTGTDRFWSVGGTNPSVDGGGIWASGGTNFFVQTGTLTSVKVAYSNTAVEDLLIGVSGGAGGTIALGSNVTVAGPLVFTPVTNPYTIAPGAGSNSLTLDGGIVSSNTTFISAPIILGGSQSISAATGTTLSLSGGISESVRHSVLTTSGVGTIILGGTSTYSGGTIISQGTLQTSTSGLPSAGIVTVDQNASLVFSQNTNGTFAGLILGNGTVTVNNSTSAATKLSNAGNDYTGATILAGGILSVDNIGELGTGDNGITFAGGTLQAAAPLNFPLATANSSTTNVNLTLGATGTVDTNGFNVIMGQIFQGPGNFTKAGQGTLSLTNIHSTNVIGVLGITGGDLAFDESGNPSFGFSGSLSTSNTYTGNLEVQEPTDVRIFGGNISGGGAINFDSTANGSILESRIISGVTDATYIANNVNLNVGGATGYGISIDADSSDTLILAGSITGVSNVDFTGGAGTVVLAGTSTYTGLTTIDESAGGEVQLGINNALPTNGPVTITSSGVLDLDGFNQTVASLASNNTTLSQAVVTNEGNTPSILTIVGSANTTYAGTLFDGQNASLGLTLGAGNTGQLTLNNPEQTPLEGGGSEATGMSGPVTIIGGRLDLQALTALGAPSTITVGATAGNSQLRYDGVSGLATYGDLANPTVPASQVNFVLNGLGGYQGDPGAISVENTSAITLPNNVTLAATSGIQVDATSTLTITGNVTGSGGLVVTGGGPLTLSGTNSFSGGASVVSGGNLVVTGTTTIDNSAHTGAVTGTGSLTVGALNSAVTLTLAPNSGPSSVSSLTINPNSTLNISNNSLTINYTPGNSPGPMIRQLLTSGYGDDTWLGTGIDSTAANLNSGLYAVGYVDGSVDAGTPAGKNQVLVEYTLAGDANLDGTVNFADLLVVAQNFNHVLDTHSNPIDWADGDFNYDGVVNFADLLLVAQNFNKQLSSAQLEQLPGSFSAEWNLALAEVASAQANNVPEPATASLLAIGAAGLLARRRRKA